MASTPGPAEQEERRPFPSISSEARLMKRSIPFSHLRGSGLRPDVIAAQPKVDTRNPSYHRKSTGGYGRKVVSSIKADYSCVTSKIDTGRRKPEGDMVRRRPRSATVTDNTVFSSQLLSARKKLAQLKRAATLPQMKLPSASYMSGDGGCGIGNSRRKVSEPSVVQRARRPVRSRIDCSDPHPAVTRQTHSLQELQIVQDTSTETLNPRFQLFHTATDPLPWGPAKTRKHSLPTVLGGTKYTNSRQRQLKRRVTDTSIVIGSCCTAIASEDSVALENSQFSMPVGGMEALREEGVANLDENRSVRRNEEEGGVVKTKPGATRLQYKKDILSEYTTGHGVGNATSSSVCHHHDDDNDPDYQPRDSVSSSESIGINPEYTTMEVDTNAFSVESELAVKPDEYSTEGGWERVTAGATVPASDKIVGFEVSTDDTQTTVNLLHLLGHKNKSVEQAETEYHDGLWVISEEQEDDESDDEMEEEIYLSDSASRGGSGNTTLALANPQPVPKLFIVDENDTIIEKVKTGRRRQSGGSLSESLTSPPPTSTDCPLSLHALTIHD